MSMDNEQLLVWACSHTNLKEVKHLVKNQNAIINCIPAFFSNHFSNDSPLMSACKAGNVKIVKYLLSNDADINMTNTYGHSALFWAVNYGHINVVKILLYNGADRQIITDIGMSIMDCAIIFHRHEILMLLQKPQKNKLKLFSTCAQYFILS
jgi:hypothetical protein